MQNVVNYLCPFFRNGTPIVNGRVYFVKPDTTAQTFTDIVALEGADFIAIKDKDGTLLENPLSLNSEGRFSVQPFVDDGIDFKMIVCYPTGVPAEINDESMTYDVAYTINSFAQDSEILSIGGVTTVDSVAALRQLEPAVKAALVRGYYAAGDFCPPRIFSWVESLMTDDNGSKIRSSVEGYTSAGTWVCTPSGFVDVRWFGVNPEGGTDCTSLVIAVAQAYPNIPVYFPNGSYYISSHVTFKSAILERLAIVFPTDDTTTDLCFSVENSFENRGGRFGKNSRECCVYPKVKGTLRTSWLSSPMDSALSVSSLSGIDEIIFDATKTVSVTLSIANRRVLVKKGVTVPSSIAFAPSCSIYIEDNGLIAAGLMKLGLDWNLAPNKTQTEDELFLKKGDTNLVHVTSALVTFFEKLKLSFGFEINDDNFWKFIENSGDPWYTHLVLSAQKARLGDASVVNASMNSLYVNKGACYGNLYGAIMRYVDGNLVMQNLSDPTQTVAVTGNVIDTRVIESWFEDASGENIHIIIPGSVLFTQYNIYFSELGSANTFLVYNPGHSILNPVFRGGSPDVQVGTVKVLGLVGFPQSPSNTVSGPERMYVRAPSDAERSRYGLSNDVKLIIDPFSL